MEAFVHEVILKQNKYSSNPFTKAFENHIYLDNSYHITKDVSGETIKVYLMVCYEEYDLSANPPKLVSGFHVPTIITLNRHIDNSMSLKEYWIPRDGSYYAKDIENNFPENLKTDALYTQKYVKEQIKSIEEQLSQYVEQ